MAIHPRLINQLFENPEFLVAPDSIGYVVRDVINMNWWNTCGVLLGYKKNKRVNGDFSEVQKRIAVQLKEYYYVRRIAIKNESKFRQEIRGYLIGNVKKIEQLNAFSYTTRMNPSQYFHKKDGTTTWVDCTSRATYAAKYVFQNGYQDFDGRARFLGASAILNAIETGRCEDLGISEYFDDGHNTVKAEIFSQKNSQLSVGEWIDRLGVKILPKREWLLDAIGHVKSDPYKINEARIVAQGLAPGVNELLYGFSTSSSVKLAMAVSAASRASAASDASRARAASRASYASRASNASRASHASGASKASTASGASNAANSSDAGCTHTAATVWSKCNKAIKKPDHLDYPPVFRKNIFGLAGNWKINADIVKRCNVGYFDPFCVDGETEYLSPSGWEKIKNYTSGPIAQYLPSGEITFIDPIRYISEPTEEDFLEFNNRSLSICATLDHSIVYNNINKAGRPLEKLPFIKFYENRHMRGVNQTKRIPITFQYTPNGSNVSISEERLRLEIAIQADAHIRKKSSTGEWEVIFGLRRERKIKRLKDLLNLNGILPREYNYIRPNGKRDTVVSFKMKSIFETPKKEFPTWLLHLPQSLREIFVEEVMHWDGCQASKLYATNSKHNADIVQFMFASCGFSSQIALSDKNYRVQKSLLTTSSMTTHDRCVFIEKFRFVKHAIKYCFTVPSGSWLMRRNDKICATGNCGHGTTPLYAKKHGINYLGFDTNKKAFDEYLNIINEECSGHGSNVKVQLQDSTEFLPKLVGQFDLCYTSPPYFNFEEYGGNTAHYDDCKSYADFHKKITIPVFTNVYEYLVPGGTLALQTEKNATAKKEWIDVIKPIGFVLESELLTGIEKQKYSTQSKRDQNLLVFRKPSV